MIHFCIQLTDVVPNKLGRLFSRSIIAVLKNLSRAMTRDKVGIKKRSPWAAARG